MVVVATIVMVWLVEELRDDSLRMSTEELSTGCASGARPTYGPPSGYSITKNSELKSAEQ